MLKLYLILKSIRSRLSKSTVSVLQERIAALEGGIGAVCTSSGHSAQILALFPLMSPGDNIAHLQDYMAVQFSNLQIL